MAGDRNGHVWWELANGKVVAWNQGRKEWSFSVITLNRTECGLGLFFPHFQRHTNLCAKRVRYLYRTSAESRKWIRLAVTPRIKSASCCLAARSSSSPILLICGSPNEVPVPFML